MAIYACIIETITQTCKEEINRKIQHKYCLCIIRLRPLRQIKFVSFRHQICWTSSSWNLFYFCAIITEQAVLYAAQWDQCLWRHSFLIRETFFIPWTRVSPCCKVCEPLKVYISSDNKMKGLQAQWQKWMEIFLDMSKSVVGWKDTETVHNLIRHPLFPCRDMAQHRAGTHCVSTINTVL